VGISRTVARRIAESYRRTSRIIYPPVDTDFYTPASVPREDRYLCVSALVPYKRIDLAISACNRLGRRLVIIGEGPEYGRLARMAGPCVELVGWRSNEEIRDHLRRSRALLFPGQEDFGIVPLEAQACQTPVIAFDRGGATETILRAAESCPGTGWFFADQTPQSLATAIREFESEPARFNARLARRQAERFSTTRFEREISRYLEEVVSASGRLRFHGPTGIRQPVAAAG
jgi:glycosyltransferase involved in cell wall biosynthesis